MTEKPNEWKHKISKQSNRVKESVQKGPYKLASIRDVIKAVQRSKILTVIDLKKDFNILR